MGRFLVIIVFVLSLVLAAWGDYYKMKHRQVYTDVLGTGLQPLKSFVPASGILYYRQDQVLTEGVIRARFVMAPVVLLPVPQGMLPDTMLLITAAADQPDTLSQGTVLWSYSDTLAHYSLVSTIAH